MSAMFMYSLLLKSRKRFALDIIDTFATRATCAHDIIDTGCWAQNGVTHHTDMFSQFSEINFICQQDEKLNEKLLQDVINAQGS